MMHRPDPKADRRINIERDKVLSTKQLYPSDPFQRESWVGKTCPCIRLVWEAQC